MACDGCYHARTMAIRELPSLLCHDRMPSDVFQPDIFLINRKIIYTAKWVGLLCEWQLSENIPLM